MSIISGIHYSKWRKF